MNDWIKEFLANNGWIMTCAVVSVLVLGGMRYSEFATKLDYAVSEAAEAQKGVIQLEKLEREFFLMKVKQESDTKRWERFEKTIKQNTEAFNRVNTTLEVTNSKFEDLDKRVDKLEQG